MDALVECVVVLAQESIVMLKFVVTEIQMLALIHFTIRCLPTNVHVYASTMCHIRPVITDDKTCTPMLFLKLPICIISCICMYKEISCICTKKFMHVHICICGCDLQARNLFIFCNSCLSYQFMKIY